MGWISHMKDKGHHTRIERQEEKERESVRLSLISGFLLWYFSRIFLGVWEL